MRQLCAHCGIGHSGDNAGWANAGENVEQGSKGITIATAAGRKCQWCAKRVNPPKWANGGTAQLEMAKMRGIRKELPPVMGARKKKL